MTRLVVQRDGDGEDDVEVTAAVRTMYDLLHSSLDWGSGFLSLEDVIEITRLAEVCGFVNLDGAREQIAAYLRTTGPCPTCLEWREPGMGAGVWRMAQATERGRSVQHHPCGHVFELVLPPNEPASLTPGGPEPEPCTHESRYGMHLDMCQDCDAVGLPPKETP